MGWEVLSEGTPPLTPASVSKIVSGINNLLKNWFEHIPEEIIHSILARIPTKSLVKCTSVCKSWRAIIKHPRFMLTHLAHTLNSNDQNATHLMLLHTMFSQGGGWRDTQTLHFDNQGFDHYCEVEIPVWLKELVAMNSYRLVGTCNGLVCLADDMGVYDCNYLLWNPSVRRYMILPKPTLRFPSHGSYEASIGLGYDARTNDYKVVRLVTLMHEDGVLEDYPTLAQVYSLAKSSWGEVRSDIPRCYMAQWSLDDADAKGPVVAFGRIGSMGQAFVNGVVHLIVLRPMGDGHHYFVLTFDVGSEAFGEIMFPKRYESKDPLALEFRLSATGDGKSIGLFVKSKSDEFLDIWVMKEYGVEKSWTKLMILTPQGPNRSLHEPLCFRKSGEVVLILQDSRGLIALDTVKKQFKHLGVSGGQFCTAYSYEESLVFLDRQDAVSY